MGAVLTQLTEQGEEHPILYLSKKFSEVEKRYCTTEKECASIVFAIKRLHYYLDGNSFLVMTDHNPLVWLNRNVSSNPRLMRWALALQPYNFRIVHRSEYATVILSNVTTTSHEDRQIVRMAVTDRSVTSRTLAQDIESVEHHSVPARTIRRRLQQSGLSARRPLLGLPLTQNHRCLRRQ
ncbi:transposon Tf2-9 polyprotein [Trichonephila clavipes]|nr:transposon Tf2-9 polyprotein [Trichonephila clavipes]